MGKNFIDINNFTKTDLDHILTLAKNIKKNNIQYKNLCKNKTLGLLFQKESTRTRLSFSIGMQKLGGFVIELDPKAIGFGTRESEEDVLKVLSQYIDCLMIRNNNHKKILSYSSLNILPIINGLSDFSHPCQILSDIFTMQEKLGKLYNKTLCWIGDFNNVLRSLIHAQNIYSFQLNIVLPKEIFKKNNLQINNIKHPKINITTDINKGVQKSDSVMTDVWVSMGEKKTRKKNIFKGYQVNNKIMQLAKKNAIFMHCLPAKRGEEVSSDVLDGSQSVVWQQAKNRIYTQQAILIYILNIK